MSDTLPPLPEPYATSVKWLGAEDGYWQQWHDADDPLPAEWEDRAPDEVVHVYTAATVRSLIAAARAQALEDAAREVDKAIGEAIAGHFNKQAISALMQTREMLKDRAMKGTP